MHINIGTRKSQLALWQANHVANKLSQMGHSCQLILIESEGDKILDTPLPLIGGKGIFTKALDDAILNKTIDIAVHSYKDIPTQLDQRLNVTAILKREKPTDALVVKNGLNFLNSGKGTIATSSNRRKAQWLHRYPEHNIVDIRGNVPTRVNKLQTNSWDATILASAGLIRLKMENDMATELDWMVPAPAQGAVAVICHASNTNLKPIIYQLNHPDTALCTNIERDFLNELNGGWSAPLGAFAHIDNEHVIFKGIVLSIDGSKKIEVDLREATNKASMLVLQAAVMASKKGAKTLIESANNEKYG